MDGFEGVGPTRMNGWDDEWDPEEFGSGLGASG